MLSASRALRLFLSALLLFSQQQAVVHSLGHGIAQVEQRDSTEPTDAVCVKCLAIAHLDHAVSVDLPKVPLVAPAPPRAARPVAFRVDLPFVASYRSRAPPVSA